MNLLITFNEMNTFYFQTLVFQIDECLTLTAVKQMYFVMKMIIKRKLSNSAFYIIYQSVNINNRIKH